MAVFTRLMKELFLDGQDDPEFINYHDIDGDASLDDHWAAEAEVDAQEAWFDAD